MQEIVFGDVVAVVISRLNARLATLGDIARAYSRVPSSRPSRFVVVQRTGGPKTDLYVTERAQLTVEAWDLTPPGAMGLAQLARSIVNGLQGESFGGLTFYGIDEFSGPADLPDPDSLTPRFTWTLSMHVRAATVVAP